MHVCGTCAAIGPDGVVEESIRKFRRPAARTRRVRRRHVLLAGKEESERGPGPAYKAPAERLSHNGAARRSLVGLCFSHVVLLLPTLVLAEQQLLLCNTKLM